jgi:DNA-binding transcriptional LysR family regulator
LRHPLASRRRIQIAEIVKYPLIMYERGSTGRQHVAEAFKRLDLVPTIEIEATNTDLIVRMVEAGLGIAVVPLHESGAVTRGRRVVVHGLGNQVRAIESGILFRRNEQPTDAALKLVDFLIAQAANGLRPT